MDIRRWTIFIISVFIWTAITGAETAQAGSGVYPDPPIQTAPLNYAEGTSTVTFSFASYNDSDNWFVGYPII